MVQDMQAVSITQQLQAQKLQQQDQELQRLKQELTMKKDTRKQEMAQLQQQINALSLEKADDDRKAQALQTQLQ